MKIRDANENDAAAIAQIWNPVIENTAATFTTDLKTAQGLAADFKAKAAAGHGFFVAQKEGALIGFATYFQFRGGPGYKHTLEHSVILAPEAKGQGTGRALMQHLISHARASGGHTLFAGVSSENPAGVAFHEAIGFQKVAQLPQVGRKFDRWMDLILLQKTL
ncbi:GNAT family N-acetyltransferase [Algirhabdus cladophorae]|uniref:GNAT family N-acetyltransferase n=1 Tax=Algirhabdus cladophorae TaxID=3377108 RepID=UPI003B8484FE